MPPLRPTFVLYHVSDVHFGSAFYPPTTSVGPLARQHRRLWRAGGTLQRHVHQGFYPHSVDSCEKLDEAIKDINRTFRPRRRILVASGDLTATGSDSEFVNALSYLHGRIVRFRDPGGSIGLGYQVDNRLEVPGNHDHWNATRWSFLKHIGSAASPLYGTYFRVDKAIQVHGGPTPVSAWLEDFAQDGVQLQLMGLDSLAGSTKRSVARGYIHNDDLEYLKKRVAAADADAVAQQLFPVRVLVVHHSLKFSKHPASSPVPFSKITHAIDPQSLSALIDFLHDAGTHFVLTGHVHTPLISQGPKSPQPPVELRCGTTLQGAPRGRMPSPYGNVLLAHFIWKGNPGAQWETRMYQRKGTGKFSEPDPPSPFIHHLT